MTRVFRSKRGLGIALLSIWIKVEKFLCVLDSSKMRNSKTKETEMGKQKDEMEEGEATNQARGCCGVFNEDKKLIGRIRVKFCDDENSKMRVPGEPV